MFIARSRCRCVVIVVVLVAHINYAIVFACFQMDTMIDVKLLTRLQTEELLYYNKLKQRREIKARQQARVQEIAQKGAACATRTIDLASPDKQAAMDLVSADA